MYASLAASRVTGKTILASPSVTIATPTRSTIDAKFFILKRLADDVETTCKTDKTIHRLKLLFDRVNLEDLFK